jgi:hypothetical protein
MPETFDLMALPAELRLCIYDFVVPEWIKLSLPPTVPVQLEGSGFAIPLLDQLEHAQAGDDAVSFLTESRRHERNYLSRTYRALSHQPRPRCGAQKRRPVQNGPVPNLAPLMRTCKLVYEEVRQLVYTRLTIQAETVADLVLFARDHKSAANWLRKIRVYIPDIWRPDTTTSSAIEVSRWLKLLVQYYEAVDNLECRISDPLYYHRFVTNDWEDCDLNLEECKFFTGILEASQCLHSVRETWDGKYRRPVAFRFFSDNRPKEKQILSDEKHFFHEIRKREVEYLKDFSRCKDLGRSYFDGLWDGDRSGGSNSHERRGRSTVRQLQSELAIRSRSA